MEESNSNKDEEYSLKIMNFLAMTQTTNEEIAVEYLLKCNWDETAAVNNFYNNTRGNQNSNNQIFQNTLLNNQIVDNSNINNTNHLLPNINKTINLNENNSDNNEDVKENNSIPTKSNSGFFGSMASFFKNLVLGICGEQITTKKQEQDNFKLMPSRIKNFTNFTSLLHKRIGLLIIYDEKDIFSINDIINQITLDYEVSNILTHNFSVYFLLSSSNEGKNIKQLFNLNFSTPAFFYLHNNAINTTLSKNSIIFRVEGYRNIYKFNQDIQTALAFIYKKNETHQTPHHKFAITKEIEEQNNQLKQLEREVELIEKQKIEMKIKEEKEKEQMEKKEIEKKLMVEEMKKKIVEEPLENDDNSTLLCFRYPDGEKRVERRFFKYHTIQNLYDFVFSLGNEIYTEPENEHFTLIQTFPFKVFNDMNKTLEEEGLFPNVMIQIREEE